MLGFDVNQAPLSGASAWGAHATATDDEQEDAASAGRPCRPHSATKTTTKLRTPWSSIQVRTLATLLQSFYCSIVSNTAFLGVGC